MVARILTALALVASVGHVLIAPPPAAAQTEVSVTLNPQNNSGITGTATLTALGNQTQVVVNVAGAPAGASLPAHIHDGTCDSLNPAPLFPLSNVENGTSTTLVNADISTLMGSQHAINLHKSPAEVAVYVACGNIPGNANGNPQVSGGLTVPPGSGVSGQGQLVPPGNGSVGATSPGPIGANPPSNATAGPTITGTTPNPGNVGVPGAVGAPATNLPTGAIPIPGTGLATVPPVTGGISTTSTTDEGGAPGGPAGAGSIGEPNAPASQNPAPVQPGTSTASGTGIVGTPATGGISTTSTTDEGGAPGGPAGSSVNQPNPPANTPAPVAGMPAAGVATVPSTGGTSTTSTTDIGGAPGGPAASSINQPNGGLVPVPAVPAPPMLPAGGASTTSTTNQGGAPGGTPADVGQPNNGATTVPVMPSLPAAPAVGAVTTTTTGPGPGSSPSPGGQHHGGPTGHTADAAGREPARGAREPAHDGESAGAKRPAEPAGAGHVEPGPIEPAG